MVEWGALQTEVPSNSFYPFFFYDSSEILARIKAGLRIGPDVLVQLRYLNKEGIVGFTGIFAGLERRCKAELSQMTAAAEARVIIEKIAKNGNGVGLNALVNPMGAYLFTDPELPFIESAAETRFLKFYLGMFPQRNLSEFRKEAELEVDIPVLGGGQITASTIVPSEPRGIISKFKFSNGNSRVVCTHRAKDLIKKKTEHGEVPAYQIFLPVTNSEFIRKVSLRKAA